MARSRGEAWKQSNELINHASLTRTVTKYTMEAWLRDNPDVCAHIILHCYNDDDIKSKDIDEMQKELTEFVQKKYPEADLGYKLYDQRGVVLQQVS